MLNQSNNNTVAIVIAAYNANQTIEKAVRSALQQNIVSQVIVVDDASQDNTPEAAMLADDHTGRLLILKLPENGGPSIARNLALKHVTANWFTVLDADDYLLEGRIEKLVSLAGDKYDLLADDMWLLQEGAPPETMVPMLEIPQTNGVSPLSLEAFMQGNLPQKGKMRRELGFLKPIIRKNKVDTANLQYNDEMRLGEDYDLYVHLLAAGANAGLTSTQGYVALRRSNSLSGMHGHVELENFYQSTKAHQNLPNLSAEAQRLAAQARTNASRKYRWAKMIHDVKHHNVKGFFASFTTSPDNILFLLCNLAQSMHDRLTNKSNKTQNKTSKAIPDQ